jgi:hypothetical protein
MTARAALGARFDRGERLLLDGATGSELQRRGLNLSIGASSEGGSGAWSATAMDDAPEVVRAVHEDSSWRSRRSAPCSNDGRMGKKKAAYARKRSSHDP